MAGALFAAPLLSSCVERARSASPVSSWTIANDSISVTVERTPDGRVGVTQLSNRADGRNWVDASSPSALFQVEYRLGGEAASLTGRSALRLQSADRTVDRDGAQHLALTLLDPSTGLRILLHWRCHPGSGPVESWYDLDNSGRYPIQILRADTFSQLLNTGRRPIRLLWVHKGTYDQGVLRVHDRPLNDGETQELLCSGTETRDDLDVVPWFMLRDGAGEQGGIYFAWEFSGFGRFEIARSATRVLVTGGLEQSRFSHALGPGERLRVPGGMFGVFRGTPDDGANAFHHFLMHRIAPLTSDPLYPRVHYNTWRSLGLDMDESGVLRHIDLAADLGAELFHLDAGWMRAMGDWRPDPKRFPRGLGPLVDAAHARGLKFGLWVPFAQISRERYDDHPDWVISPHEESAATFDDPIKTFPMCLGSPAVLAWAHSELDRIVRAYHVDFIEYDQPFLEECRSSRHGHQTGDGNYRAVMGLYHLYDELRTRYPALLFESCMNGGHVTDYGILRRTHLFSLTDLYDPLSNRIAAYGATYPFPPSYCEGYMQEASDEPSRYQFRSFMMGVWSISADAQKWSAAKFGECRRQIALYKRLRPLIRDGNVYHILPQADGRHWDGLEYYDPRTGRGVVFVFRPPASADAHRRIRLAGLTPEAGYQVTFEDTPTTARLTGHELMMGTLDVALPQPFDTAIIHLERSGEE